MTHTASEQHNAGLTRIVCLAALILLLMPLRAHTSATDGTIQSSASPYAWSENMGWINFAPVQGDIRISDVGLSGYAWSQNIGWINLAPTNSGQRVTNDGEGHLSGFAWSSVVGWIDFSNVVISSAGKFTGTAYSTATGRITFDCDICDIETDWRPASSRTSTSEPSQPTGGNGPIVGSLPSPTPTPAEETPASSATTTIVMSAPTSTKKEKGVVPTPASKVITTSSSTTKSAAPKKAPSAKASVPVVASSTATSTPTPTPAPIPPPTPALSLGFLTTAWQWATTLFAWFEHIFRFF